MGGRKVSRPYRVWFFTEGERFYPFGDDIALAGEGGVGDVVWLILKGCFLCFCFSPPVFFH